MYVPSQSRVQMKTQVPYAIGGRDRDVVEIQPARPLLPQGECYVAAFSFVHFDSPSIAPSLDIHEVSLNVFPGSYLVGI